MRYFVYIIYSGKAKRKYIGQTMDVETRVQQHNTNFFKGYTNDKGRWKLVHTEAFLTRSEALLREKWLKSGIGREWIKKEFNI